MITVYDKYVELGQTADLFHAFAPYRDRLLCFFRRHVLQPPDVSPYGKSVLCMAEWDGQRLHSEREIFLGGEDPRVVAHDAKIYVFT